MLAGKARSLPWSGAPALRIDAKFADS